MKSRKKKMYPVERQRLISAHYKNEYLAKFGYLMNSFAGDNTLFKQIPKWVQDLIFEIRLRPLRIVRGECCELKKAEFEQVKNFLKEAMMEFKLPYAEVGPVVTMEVYLTVGITLRNFINNLPDNYFPAARHLKEKLSLLINQNYNQVNENPDIALYNRLISVLEFLSFDFGDFSRQIIRFGFDIVQDSPEKHPVGEIRIDSFKPGTHTFVREGKRRNAHQICWWQEPHGLMAPSIEPHFFGIVDDKIASVPLYIQPHALRRLHERLDNIEEHFIPLFIIISLTNPVITHLRDQTYLIDFLLLEKKVGYLVTELIDEKLLIETFLFITNSGTPEGDKLEKITRLQKLSRNYLLIDKLSTFYNSDIQENDRLKEIFFKAGCRSIFEVNPRILTKSEKNKISLANKILNFIELEKSSVRAYPNLGSSA